MNKRLRCTAFVSHPELHREGLSGWLRADPRRPHVRARGSSHPVERGAATTFVTADGTRTVVGKPIQLFGPDGGVLLLDAGLVTFGEELLVRGPHPSLEVDNLAPFYCPSGN
jgi:hypothetical protein